MESEKKTSDLLREESERTHDEHRTPGTVVLVLVLLASFVVYYFANWKALSDVWHVR